MKPSTLPLDALPTTIAAPPPAASGNDYATAEARVALAENSLRPYLLLQNPLCREFLRFAASPLDLPAVRVFFPFVRDAMVYQLPLPRKHLADWMYFGFLAGCHLAADRPDLLEEVLPDHEARQCRLRLDLIRQITRQPRLTGSGLRYAFHQIVHRQWANVPEAQLPAVYAEAALKALRTGFAAVALAPSDPGLSEYVDNIPRSCADVFTDIVWKAHAGAPLNALDQSLAQRLEHPLLKLARGFYPGRPTERDNLLAFFRTALSGRGVISENECPAGDDDLADWLLDAMAYSQCVQRERPDVVERIIAEATPQFLRDSLVVVRSVVGGAASVDPRKLLPVLVEWQANLYGWTTPGFYGRALARLVYLVDFVMWIPWVLALDRGRPHGFVFLRGRAPLSNTDELPPPPDVKREARLFPPTHATLIRQTAARQLRAARSAQPSIRTNKSVDYIEALRVLRSSRKSAHPDFQ